MIINVADPRFAPGLRQARDRRIDAAPLIDGEPFDYPDPSYPMDELVEVTEEESIAAIVDKIINKVMSRNQGHGSIWLLRLICHGNRGYMQLGTGLRTSTAGPFRELRSWFTARTDVRQGIELHSCGVASTTSITDAAGQCVPGTAPTGGLSAESLVQKLADLTGAQVRGGIHCQLGDYEFQFEGPVVTADPQN